MRILTEERVRQLLKDGDIDVESLKPSAELRAINRLTQMHRELESTIRDTVLESRDDADEMNRLTSIHQNQTLILAVLDDLSTSIQKKRSYILEVERDHNGVISRIHIQQQ